MCHIFLHPRHQITTSGTKNHQVLDYVIYMAEAWGCLLGVVIIVIAGKDGFLRKKNVI